MMNRADICKLYVNASSTIDVRNASPVSSVYVRLNGILLWYIRDPIFAQSETSL